MMGNIIKNKRFILISLVFTIFFGSFLRLYRLDKDPVSLFGDELDVGYQALSLLKTGRDYSGNFLPMHIQSLAEWRTPLYIYASIPTIAFFGISSLGVRLPAAVFGILGILITYFLTKELTKNKYIGLISAILISILPWHIHYSRAGFEATMLYIFFFAGILFFLYGLRKNIWLIPTAILLGFTPWIYSTAKLFLPLTVVAMFLIWHKDIFKIKKIYLVISSVIFLLITVPFAINTVFGQGVARFDSISIFNHPTLSGEIGAPRVVDQEMGDVSQNPFLGKILHNKLIVFGNIFIDNYFETFSTDFLFTKGDPSPRQNSSASGELYAVESVLILAGICFVLTGRKAILGKEKYTFLFLLFASPIPGALTQDGGNHATRQFLLVFPLIVVASIGLVYVYRLLKGNVKFVWAFAIVGILLWSTINYLHYYFVHYPWDSERWWQAGYQEMVSSAISESKNYDQVMISSAGEPSLKYFLAWSEYPPSLFQKDGTRNTALIKPFGTVAKEGKFLFPPVGKFTDLYSLSNVLPVNTLYVATTEEVVFDLGKYPERIPKDIKVIKIIRYPSGEPVFYLLTKR